MMKFSRKIFFTIGFYRSFGTFTAPSREIADIFYEILVLNFRFQVANISGKFHVKMMACGANIIRVSKV